MKNGKPKQPQVRAQITITLFDDGGLHVKGPMQDSILYLGMLGAAHDSLRAHREKQDEKRAAAEAVKGSMPWWRWVIERMPAVLRGGDKPNQWRTGDPADRAINVAIDDSKAGGEALRGEGKTASGLPLPTPR